MYNEGFSWVKFGILLVPFVIAMFIFAPSFKWKVLLSIAGAAGIWLALIGKGMKGVTPMVGRRFRR